MHFKNLDNLRVVAVGCLRGLKLLAEAGVVHCDMKAGTFARFASMALLLLSKLLEFWLPALYVQIASAGRQLHVDKDRRWRTNGPTG